jgi:G3E family GTPase
MIGVPATRTPVVLITGFLGSGKTTLINHLLAGGRLGRVAALVNDFGAINIDAALIASVADEVVQLTNGCVCCTINGDLYGAAQRTLALEPAVDAIVVETTGLADPLPVGLTFLQTDLRERTSLEAVVTVVDCANFALDLFETGPALAQIVHGDVIVLNKADLVAPDDLESLERRIAVLKPRARTLRSSFGRVPRAALLGDLDSGLSFDLLDEGHDRHDVEGDRFQAEAFRLDTPLAAERFQALLDGGLPEGVFRAKGFVRFAGSDQVYLFQLCGSRSSFDACETEVGGTELVFIGRNLDRASLADCLSSCLAQPASLSPGRHRVAATAGAPR